VVGEADGQMRKQRLVSVHADKIYFILSRYKWGSPIWCRDRKVVTLEFQGEVTIVKKQNVAIPNGF